MTVCGGVGPIVSHGQTFHSAEKNRLHGNGTIGPIHPAALYHIQPVDSKPLRRVGEYLPLSLKSVK